MIHWFLVCYLDTITEIISKSELCILAHCFYLWPKGGNFHSLVPFLTRNQTPKKQSLSFLYKKPWYDNSFWHSNNKTRSPCKYVNTCLFFLISYIQIILSNAHSRADSYHKRKQKRLCFFRWAFICSYHRCHMCLSCLNSVRHHYQQSSSITSSYVLLCLHTRKEESFQP